MVKYIVGFLLISLILLSGCQYAKETGKLYVGSSVLATEYYMTKQILEKHKAELPQDKLNEIQRVLRELDGTIGDLLIDEYNLYDLDSKLELVRRLEVSYSDVTVLVIKYWDDLSGVEQQRLISLDTRAKSLHRSFYRYKENNAQAREKISMYQSIMADVLRVGIQTVIKTQGL